MKWLHHVPSHDKYSCQKSCGLLPQVDGLLEGLKLVLVWQLVLLSSAAVSQLIARSERRRETRP